MYKHHVIKKQWNWMFCTCRENIEPKQSNSNFADIARKDIQNELVFTLIIGYLIIYNHLHSWYDAFTTSPIVTLCPDSETGTCQNFIIPGRISAQTSNMRLNSVAKGTDIIAAPSATPNIRCEIEKVALNCGFFSGRWGDSGRFATGPDRERLACRDRLSDGDTFRCPATRGQDAYDLACLMLEKSLKPSMLSKDELGIPRAPRRANGVSLKAANRASQWYFSIPAHKAPIITHYHQRALVKDYMIR